MARARKFKFNADTPSFICAAALQVRRGTIRTLSYGQWFASFNFKFWSYQCGSLDIFCIPQCNFLTYFKVDFLGVQMLGRLSVLLDKRFLCVMYICKYVFLRDLKLLDTLDSPLWWRLGTSGLGTSVRVCNKQSPLALVNELLINTRWSLWGVFSCGCIIAFGTEWSSIANNDSRFLLFFKSKCLQKFSGGGCLL